MTPIAIHRRTSFVAVVFPTCIEASGDGGAPPPEGPVLIDSFPVEQQNDINSYGIMDSLRSCYQVFTAPRDARLGSVKLSLKRVGNPVGNVFVSLYRANSVPIPNAVPQVVIGNSIGETQTLDVATISPDATPAAGILYEFPFRFGNIVQGENYALALEKVDTDGWGFASPDRLMAGFYFGDTGHSGNGGYWDLNVNYPSGGWASDDFADMIFYLYEKP